MLDCLTAWRPLDFATHGCGCAGSLSAPGKLTQALSQSTTAPFPQASTAVQQADTGNVPTEGMGVPASSPSTTVAPAAVAPGTPEEVTCTPGRISAPDQEQCAVGHAVAVLGQQRQYDAAVMQDVTREIKLRKPDSIDKPSLKGTMIAATSWVLNSPAPRDSSQQQAASFQNPFVPQIPRSSSEFQAVPQNQAAAADSGDVLSRTGAHVGSETTSVMAGRRPSNMSGCNDAALRTFEGMVHEAGAWSGGLGGQQRIRHGHEKIDGAQQLSKH